MNANIIVTFLFAITFAFLTRFATAYLSPSQWTNIKSMIVRPDLSPDIRNTLNKVMYTHYTKWAFYETVRFKTFHYYKCKHIPTEELHMYSLLGLQNGIEKYDGVHSFTNWIHYHIKRRL